MLPLLLVRTKLGGVNGCKFIIYKLLTFRLRVLYFNPIQFFKIWFRMRQQNTSGNGKWPSLKNGKWQSPPSPRLIIKVDHRIVGIIAFVLVLVNPLSATPLFSQHGLRALVGLVVFMPRGRSVAPVQNLPQGACYQAMHQFPLVDAVMDSSVTVSARTCQQWQVPPWSWILQTWRVESRKQPTGCMAWQPTG